MELGKPNVEERIVPRIAGFVLLYLVLIIAGVLIVAALGSDVTTATSGVVSMIGNMGPALGEAGPASNYLVFSRPARAVLAAWMLLGRLELFAIVVLFVPGYRAAGQWRHRAQHRVATRAG